MFRPDPAVTRGNTPPHASHDTPGRRAGHAPGDVRGAVRPTSPAGRRTPIGHGCSTRARSGDHGWLRSPCGHTGRTAAGTAGHRVPSCDGPRAGSACRTIHSDCRPTVVVDEDRQPLRRDLLRTDLPRGRTPRRAEAERAQTPRREPSTRGRRAWGAWSLKRMGRVSNSDSRPLGADQPPPASPTVPACVVGDAGGRVRPRAEVAGAGRRVSLIMEVASATTANMPVSAVRCRPGST